jgi:hypothetical protein
LLVPAFKQNHLCHNSAVPGTPPVCGGDCTNPNAKCVVTPSGTDCACEIPCGLNAAGQCGGECDHQGQVCQLVTTNGVVRCTCDPPVDTCHLTSQPGTPPVCGGKCTDPTAKCEFDSTGTCNCVKPCGSIGIRRCGGDCPTAAEFCRVKPDDSGCECAPTSPQPCGPDAAGQCGGTCPNNDACVHSGPVPGGQCVCGPINQ